MQHHLENNILLTYVYDPMCGWCWGYRPTWIALKEAIGKQLPEIKVQYQLGGLAPDSSEPMPDELQSFLKETWQRIASQLGTQFNFSFWEDCQPRRSTYPACRACLIARGTDQEEQMIVAIQEAYYLNAQNPSDESTLIELAKKQGIDVSEFAAQLSSATTQQTLLNEINNARSMPIQGFPSLVLTMNHRHYPIPVDYLEWQTSLLAIKEIISYHIKSACCSPAAI